MDEWANPGMVVISTVDDGIWSAQCTGGVKITEEVAKQLIKKFDEFEGNLPNEKELNNMLSHFGLWGECTG